MSRAARRGLGGRTTGAKAAPSPETSPATSRASSSSVQCEDFKVATLTCSVTGKKLDQALLDGLQSCRDSLQHWGTILLRRSEADGNKVAAFYLGKLYYSGYHGGKEQSYDEALSSWIKSLEQSCGFCLQKESREVALQMYTSTLRDIFCFRTEQPTYHIEKLIAIYKYEASFSEKAMAAFCIGLMQQRTFNADNAIAMYKMAIVAGRHYGAGPRGEQAAYDAEINLKTLEMDVPLKEQILGPPTLDGQAAVLPKHTVSFVYLPD